MQLSLVEVCLSLLCQCYALRQFAQCCRWRELPCFVELFCPLPPSLFVFCFFFIFSNKRDCVEDLKTLTLSTAAKLPSRKIFFPLRLLHGEKMQKSRFLSTFMLGSCLIFRDNVPLNKSPCFALRCREVSAFPCLRPGFYWRSDFDVYASSFLPAYQPASNNSLKSHVARFCVHSVI